ncbi:NAD(P)-dependent oxidoreductase [Anaeromyxobacter oryzae]|uniref:Dehydrogenase n=1 Tax=Anaeromyxobacter oryzae TaxID=2918170 RepID=A0ABN6MX86_9BACT|nr:NAD(P)-dependent oxidoreductase [Anaeromyxobacter oryzae]BDG05592.1 dehydrogenase [Anaeromyxobacter oryzae]
MTTIAILGTGRMGGAFARRLHASGFQLTLWDRTRKKAERVGVGRAAATPAEAVRDAAVVLSSLTGPSAVREVYLGPGGVLEEAAGKVLVEMSTAGAGVIEELGRRTVARGAVLVEAPVMGSVPAAEAGTLAVLAGGAREDVDRVRPVLERLGELHHVGPLGSASRLKLVANSTLAITSAAAAELLAAGTRVGLQREQVYWALARLVPGLDARRAGYLLDGPQPTLFAVRDLLKDLVLALDLYAPSGVPVPLTSLARELFGATAQDWADLDISAIAGPPATHSRIADAGMEVRS